MGMSPTVKLTAALWAALTDITADHRQSKLHYQTSFHDQVLATSILPPGTAAWGTPNPHPIVHKKEAKKTKKNQKKNSCAVALKKNNNKDEGSEGAGTTA